MDLANAREAEVTRQKLALLEQTYEETRTASNENEHVRELTLRSLRRLINRFKEELARFEAHARVRERIGETPRVRRSSPNPNPQSPIPNP